MNEQEDQQGTTVERRSVLMAGGVLAVAPVLSPLRLAALQEDGWAPKVLSAKQLDAVERLVEALIPRTDTPGARDALVHRYIDEVLSTEPEARRSRFFAGLQALQDLGKARFKARRMSRWTDDELTEVLTEVSEASAESTDETLVQARRFFSDLKQRTVTGYYTSRAGWVEELGLPDGPFTTRLRGCEHDAEHG